MARATVSVSKEEEQPWYRTALRWSAAFLVAVFVAWGSQRGLLAWHASSAARVVLTDYARFEGCLFAAPQTVPDAQFEERLRDLALGSGDELWPHSCSAPLTRLLRASEQLAAAEPAQQPLARAVQRAEVGLGEAIFWTRHEQEQHPAAPTWTQGLVPLRAQVQRFARERNLAIPAPELPRSPRIARDRNAPPPPPIPVALPSGHEAELVDAIATTTEFGVLLRDFHGRYSICTTPVATVAPLQCVALTLNSELDTRDLSFAPSTGRALPLLWMRSPTSARGPYDPATQSLVLLARGTTHALHDYFIGTDRYAVLQIVGAGASLLYKHQQDARTLALPAGADVTSVQRAMIEGAEQNQLEIFWIDGRTTGRTTLVSATVALETTASVQSTHRWQTWSSPRMDPTERMLVPCSNGTHRRAVLLRDQTGAFLWMHGTLISSLSQRVFSAPVLHCAASTVLLTEGADAWLCAAGRGGTAAGALGCSVFSGLQTASARALIDDAVIEANAPVDGPLVLRRVTFDGQSTQARIENAQIPSVRRIRVIGHGQNVLVLAAGTETWAFRSNDGGRSFSPAVIAQ